MCRAALTCTCTLLHLQLCLHAKTPRPTYYFLLYMHACMLSQPALKAGKLASSSLAYASTQCKQS